jgi:hypothetical protein
MDNKYIKLFSEITRATSVLSEQVMDYDKTKEDEKGEQTAQIMRDDFTKLHDKLEKGEELSRADFAKLLVGAFIMMRNIEDKIEAQQKALIGYKEDIMPKLDKIINESENDEGARKIADEIFQIIEETK